MGFVRFQPLFWALLGVGGLGLGGCDENPDNNYEPVSDACIACLSEKKSSGCKVEYDACEQVNSCDAYVTCQLMGQCFERRRGSGCEQELGCNRPPREVLSDAASQNDAGGSLSPRELASAVENCARTTCAKTCGFVAD